MSTAPVTAPTAPPAAPSPGRPARGSRALSGHGPAPAPGLRLVPQARARLARAPFLGVVVAVLAVGLLALLGLNTLLAQGSFHLHELQAENKRLAVREQVLRGEVDARQAPAALAAQAEAQGMVLGGPPAFLRLPDGAVLGRPTPATAPPPPAPEPEPAAARAPAATAPAAGATDDTTDSTADTAAEADGAATQATPEASTAPKASATPKASTAATTPTTAPTTGGAR